MNNSKFGSDHSGYDGSFRNTTFNRNSSSINSVLFTVLQNYVIPILSAIGLVANFLSFLVFTRSRLKKKSFSVYLAALAISDNCFLINAFVPKLSIKGLILYYLDGICQIITYTTQVAICSSAWLLVAFTIERWFAITYPFKKNTLCTKSRAIKVTFGVVTAIFIIYSYVLICVGLVEMDQAQSKVCTVKTNFKEMFIKLTHLDTAIGHFLPAILITCFNILIAVRLVFKKLFFFLFFFTLFSFKFFVYQLFFSSLFKLFSFLFLYRIPFLFYQ